MNKSELIDELAHQCEMTKAAAARNIESLTEIITKELTHGREVAIPGFGTFATNNRAARSGRNPQTGEVIKIAAARVVKFKPGKKLKEAVSK